MPQAIARCVDLSDYAMRMARTIAPDSPLDADCMSSRSNDTPALYLLRFIHGPHHPGSTPTSNSRSAK